MTNTYGSLIDRFDIDLLDETTFTLEEISAARAWPQRARRLRPARPRPSR
jgi:hypothetical protein